MIFMIKLYHFLYETGPSAQGLGSYDERYGVPTAIDRADDAGILDLYDKLDGEMEEMPEDEETSGRVNVKITP
jgi:hypothetical protein